MIIDDQDDDCRWDFLPFATLVVDTDVSVIVKMRKM